ncbi:DNA-binding response regulator [Bremerella cremea]|uniref:DNA-binding response regulator n=1 Tax=Bremerella cremea TaxID=1031537 RepID=A0A368KMJ4_9BACT|nr:response regulator transcription factor [Bremerella cremea]RCS40555.1 DNA-binding response regulator [Bremerella cremea]
MMLAKSNSEQRFPRVLIVDDDDAIMRAVSRVLDTDESIQIVGQTTHAQAALAMAETVKPDVVLMDIHMHGLDPFLACLQIARVTNGHTKVLFYTGFPKDNYLDRCLAVGAAGIVSKHSESLRNLAFAIRHVAAGNTYFSPELDKRLTQREDGLPVSRLATLTEREVGVLRELALGRTQSEIADALDISERTVNKTVGDLKTKIDVQTINQMLIFAVNEGLVHPELIFVERPDQT